MSINVQVGVRGFFKFILHEGLADAAGNQIYDERGVPMVVAGTERDALDWFPNTVLDIGSNYMGDNSGYAAAGSWCQVGTNGTPPTPTDGGLLGWFAATNTEEANSNGQQNSEPFYGWDRRTYRFPLGATAAILKEVAIGWGSGEIPPEIASNAFARTVTVDPLGVPTDVIPLITEVLDVLFELRYYPMLGDVEDSVVLDGDTFDTTTRAASVTGSDWSSNIGQEVTDVNYSNSFAAFDGLIGAITLGPSGTADDIDGTPFPQAYGANNFYRDIVAPCGINGWSLGSGIRSIVCTTTVGKFQTEFNNQVGGTPVIKGAGQSMSITWRISFAGWLFDGNWNVTAPDNAAEPIAGAWNTNVAETTLRINWTDDDTGDRKSELQVPDGTVFHMQADSDPEVWQEFTVNTYVEGTAATSYTVSNVVNGPGGIPALEVCTVRAQTP